MGNTDETPAVVETANLADTEGSAPQAEQTAPQNDVVQGEETASPDQEPRRDTKAEKRIKKLDGRAKQAEESVRALEAEKLELQTKLDSIQIPEEYDEGFDTGKQTAAILNRELTARDVESRSREIAQINQRQEAELLREAAEKVEVFKVSAPDYSESVKNIAHLEGLADTVIKLDKAAEVYYALSKNPQEAVYINSLPREQQLIELGRFSANISVQPKTVSNAPAPIESAQGGSSIISGGYRDDMSMEEFSAWHDKRRSAAK